MTDISFAGFGAFLRLEIRRALRNRRYLAFAIAFPVVFYLLYTNVLSGGADPNARVDGIAWPIYFMVSMATYGAIGGALGGAVVIAEERSSGWTRQLRVTPLPSAAYVLGKLAVSYLVTLPAVTVVLMAGALANGVSMGAQAWIAVLVSLAVGALPFAALGLLVGYLFDARSAQGAVMILYFTLAIVGGLWAPLSSFPNLLATIGEMLPSFRLADLGRIAASGGPPSVVDLAVLGAWAIAVGASVAWRYRSEALAGA